MKDRIVLLPDSIANQIAAGEVVQRPASVVKELMENALDAGSENIQLIVRDSGKTLIQVVDDGAGMSETDARKSFERHATSKIKTAQDLFSIQTMGFRGEALASIAAIAQVELKTKLANADLGTHIVIQGSKVKKQEPCSTTTGTSISVKNLFFNVPARRKFLKSDPVELRHIMEEFHRIALANPEIFFSLYHNDQEIYHLSKSNYRQRLVNIFGKSMNERILPVEESTDFIEVAGFIGKPENSKKRRGEQYLFVNRRFIKSNYLNHAIRSAYEELIPKDHYPFYVLFLSIDPAQIDVNVHPTKTEIKFEEERLIYNYVKVSARHALGKYAIIPTIDFDSDKSFDQISSIGNKGANNKSSAEGWVPPDTLSKPNKKEILSWQKFYDDLSQQDVESTTNGDAITVPSNWEVESTLFSREKSLFQIHASLIMSSIKSGILVVDQQAAHERILYEKNLKMIQDKEAFVQRELFPQTLEFNPADAEMLLQILDRLNKLGFQIEDFGKNSFIVRGIPANLPSTMDSQELLRNLLAQYQVNLEFQMGIDETLARAMATSASIKRGKKLDEEEMQELIDQLFACDVPYKSPFGRKCFITMNLEEIYKRFID
jgi:DNA mismatch repair protein MutL